MPQLGKVLKFLLLAIILLLTAGLTDARQNTTDSGFFADDTASPRPTRRRGGGFATSEGTATPPSRPKIVLARKTYAVIPTACAKGAEAVSCQELCESDLLAALYPNPSHLPNAVDKREAHPMNGFKGVKCKGLRGALLFPPGREPAPYPTATLLITDANGKEVRTTAEAKLTAPKRAASTLFFGTKGAINRAFDLVEGKLDTNKPVAQRDRIVCTCPPAAATDPNQSFIPVKPMSAQQPSSATKTASMGRAM